MSSYTISIPNWHPVRLNMLMAVHHMKAYRLKEADKEVVAWYMSTVPPATTKRRLTLTIVLPPGRRGGDPSAYWKSLEDSLVSCKRLVNDSKEWVELAPVRYERGQAPASIITLEDL